MLHAPHFIKCCEFLAIEIIVCWKKIVPEVEGTLNQLFKHSVNLANDRAQTGIQDFLLLLDSSCHDKHSLSVGQLPTTYLVFTVANTENVS